MFLDKDAAQSEEELKCFGHCLANALEHFMKAEFKESAKWLENAQRSLNRLQRMKNNKATHDQAEFILSQIKSDQDMADMLVNALVKDYE